MTLQEEITLIFNSSKTEEKVVPTIEQDKENILNRIKLAAKNSKSTCNVDSLGNPKEAEKWVKSQGLFTHLSEEGNLGICFLHWVGRV